LELKIIIFSSSSLDISVSGVNALGNILQVGVRAGMREYTPGRG